VRRSDLYAYRSAAARTAGSRERSAGITTDDPAALWLALNPQERTAFTAQITTTQELAGWCENRRRARGAPRT
jgi:hypothetical protein